MKFLAEKILTIFKCKQRIKSNDKYEYVKKKPTTVNFHIYIHIVFF